MDELVLLVCTPTAIGCSSLKQALRETIPPQSPRTGSLPRALFTGACLPDLAFRVNINHTIELADARSTCNHTQLHDTLSIPQCLLTYKAQTLSSSDQYVRDPAKHSANRNTHMTACKCQSLIFCIPSSDSFLIVSKRRLEDLEKHFPCERCRWLFETRRTSVEEYLAGSLETLIRRSF
ncbi:hypothetical protein F5Y15DRAFT_277772 [Xylariaceae sp. FL0016]|nr:hypothetical protein F5Y15DRAFT_277772 [Xylariaceae sp. FL0016]